MRTLCCPDKQQQLWADCEIGVIIHYSRGLLGMERLDGVPCEKAADPARLTPRNLDTDQWLSCAKELGAKYAVLVANQRNCQGISLWQSRSNPYSLSRSPYMNGKFDCVREFIRSCKKYDILPGLYYQVGYGGHYYEKEKYRTPGTPEHEEYLRVTQGDLKELWGNYGTLFEIWFDGGADSDVDIEDLLREYQPEAICFQGPSGHGKNVRWVGNEDGIAPIDTWSTADINVCRFDGTKKDGEIGRGCPGGKFWFPAETDMGNRKPQAAGSGWGWAPGEEHLCWTAEELLERYFTSVGRNSNLLLGECINDEGFFPDSLQFRKFGEKIREIYRKKVAETAGEGPVFHVVVPTDAVCRTISIMEEIRWGERIRKFRVIAETEEGDREVFQARCVGHRRLIPLGEIRAKGFRLEIMESEGRPKIRSFAVYG